MINKKDQKPFDDIRYSKALANKLELDVTSYFILDFLRKDKMLTSLKMAKMLNVSITSITNKVRTLQKRKLLTLIKEDENEYLSNASFSDRNDNCWICGTTFPLDYHHYPIRAKDGGKDVIPLCCNHHKILHRLVDRGYYVLSEKANKELEWVYGLPKENEAGRTNIPTIQQGTLK